MITKRPPYKEHKNDVNHFIRFNHKDDISLKSVIKKLKLKNIPVPQQ
jgi:hypothetical protein